MCSRTPKLCRGTRSTSRVTDGDRNSEKRQASDSALHVSSWGGEEYAGVRLFPAPGQGAWLERSCRVCWHRTRRDSLSGGCRPLEEPRLPDSDYEAPQGRS